MAPETLPTAATKTRERSDSHLRSASHPAQATLTAPEPDLERPRTAPRTDSTETRDSTPQTDITEYPWSEKASTAMTSAAVTPARGSKRTSSQAHPSGSEASSMPKVDSVDADWMRQELEKHKKAHEERLQQAMAQAEQEAPAVPSDATPTQTSSKTVTPARAQVPRRKPVPQRAPSTRESESSRAASRQDSRMSIEQVGAANKLAVESPQTTGREDGHPDRNGSHVPKVPERTPSRLGERARSITRQVQEYVRPGTSNNMLKPRESSRPASRAVSRAASVSRRVREYVRPNTAVSSRKPSLDMARPSFDTFRSATSLSELEPSSATSSGNKWQTWKPFHRRRGSRPSEDGSRPGTAGSTTDNRGRTATRDNGTASQSAKSKPPIDLNRDLPPLPSLNSWKDDGKEAPQTSDPHSPSKKQSESVTSPKSPRSRHEVNPLILEPEERDAILAARMGAPTPPRSNKPSVDLRHVVPPQPTLPPPPPPIMSATLSGPADLQYAQYEHPAPTMSAGSSLTSSRENLSIRRSKSVFTNRSREFHGPAKTPTFSIPESEKSYTTGQASVINYNRVPGGPATGLRKPLSRFGQEAATTNHTAVGHSRNNSDHANFSRKLSMDEYSQSLYDNRFQNIAEITSPTRRPPPIPQMRDKKWWQMKMPKKAEKPWVDHPRRSGSNSGASGSTEAAGAPVIRY
jgi:hypothetical protein